MRVLNYLFKGLSWVVIAIIAIYIAIAAPILFGYRPVVVLSGSMEPTFPVGSVVYYSSCSFDELQEGDPITFKAEDSLVTHRITAVNSISRTVVTKGDNNTSEDPVPIDENDIVGKTTERAIPFAGYFVTYGKKPIAIEIMAVILLVNYVLENFFSKQKEEKKSEGEE